MRLRMALGAGCALLAAGALYAAGGDQDGMEGGMGLPQPTEHHEFFEKWEGTWDAKVKFTMMPGAPAMESKGTAVNKVGPGAFWITADFTGTFMNMPFTGHGVYGYDPVTNKHNGFWVDSIAPVRMLSEGGCTNGCKKVEMHSETFDPGQGKNVKMREVTEWKDDDHVALTMSTPGPDGKEFTMMTIEYARRKAAPTAK